MNFFTLLKSLFISVPRRNPTECAEAVRGGTVILIDVREPREWEQGIVEGAVRLPLSDLMGRRTRWKPFLVAAGGAELVCYCAMGGRSALAAKALAAEGFSAANGGAIDDWKAAQWRIVRPERV